MEKASTIWSLVDAKKDAYTDLADRVWDTPETAYTEYSSVAVHTDMLRKEGFRVAEDVSGIPTAVMGEAGSGGPVIALLGEYDALPGLSQKAELDYKCPVEDGGNGHGCGHNLLGAGALLAAVAVKNWLESEDIEGRVRYYGCPAEEGGAAKAFMVRNGAFKDVDIAITWHPGTFNYIDPALALANMRMDFEFFGRTSHAAASPHLGRSALDAVELMNVGVNYLREHMPSGDRIHYAMMDGGGIAPNVVQGYARVRYAVRSTTTPGMMALNKRVLKVAEGAALMTETQVKVKVLSAVSNLLGNTPLEQASFRNFEALGPVPFDEADFNYARKIQATLSEEDIETDYRRVGVTSGNGQPLHQEPIPLDTRGEPMIGSTDVGDVSWVVPTVQFWVATQAVGTPGHSWQTTAQGKSPAAHRGMMHAAKAMAATAVDFLLDGDLMAAAKADLQKRVARVPYVCPIPDDVDPPLQPRPVE